MTIRDAMRQYGIDLVVNAYQEVSIRFDGKVSPFHLPCQNVSRNGMISGLQTALIQAWSSDEYRVFPDPIEMYMHHYNVDRDEAALRLQAMRGWSIQLRAFFRDTVYERLIAVE